MLAENVVETDVLIIGGALAGCFAAIRAKELGADVLMVEAGRSGLCGMSVIGMMGLRVFHPDDDFDVAMEGTVVESEYMADQEAIAVVIRETWDRFQDLLKFGINFRKDEKGQIQWGSGITSLPWCVQRHAMWEPRASYKHLWKIKSEAARRGVKVIDRVLVTDLLTSDGKVRGAVGFHTTEGNFYVFKAKTVIIATGTFGGGGPQMPHPQLTGDGMAMALRAGAELRGMEFGKGEMGCFSPSLAVRVGSDADCVIINARGEEFLEKYELGRRVSGRRYAGPPFRLHLRAVLRECMEGRGPCYIEHKVTKGRCELTIGGGQPQGGGIKINIDGETCLPGLYAAGAVADNWGCTTYTIPVTLSGAIVTGHRAGESAARYSLAQHELDSIDQEQVSTLEREVYAPLERKQGVTGDEIRMKIMEAWVNIDLRNETRLKKACEEFKELEKDTSKAMAKDYHELIKHYKLRNYVQCAQAVAGAALIRRESRLDHYREDYPLTDNKEWLKWVITRRVGDAFHTSLEDIPIERWKYRPEPTVYDLLRPREEGA